MIVLTILKWIGLVLLWTILGLLALALLILLVVLFVPFRYRVGVATGDGTGAKVRYSFHITWILHAVSVRKKPDSSQTVIRLFGIPIRRMGGEEPSAGEMAWDDTSDDVWDDEKADYGDEAVDSEIAGKTGEADLADEPDDSVNAEKTSEATSVEPDETEEEKGQDEPAEAKNIEGEQIQDDIDINTEDKNRKKEDKISLEDRIEAVKQSVRKKFQKLDFLFYKIHSIISFVKGKTTVRTIKRLLREVVRAIRYVGPQRLEGHLEFGTGDPGSTGMILAGVSLCRPVYGKRISIVPNFDEKCLIGDATVTGRVRVVYFLRMALRIWFDKDVHRLWKQYRRMKKDIKRKEKQLAREYQG